MPDFEVADFTARICRVQIHNIGPGVPCVYHSDAGGLETYAKSAEEAPFLNQGSVEIDGICPVGLPDAEAEDNQFSATIYYEMPPQTGLAAGPYKINGGLKLGESTIWVSSSAYQATAATYGANPIEASTLNTGTTKPFVTPYPFVSFKDRASDEFDLNEGLFVKYLIKPQHLTRGDYTLTITPPAGLKICLVVVEHIGENMPCTEPPGPEETGYENMVITYADGVEADAKQCGKKADVEFKVSLQREKGKEDVLITYLFLLF